MALRPRPIRSNPYEPTCDRLQALAEKDEMREWRRQDRRCHMINTRPGFQTLANMKYSGG